MGDDWFYKPTVHSMRRRCFNWDYCAPAIYMITLTLADRSKPLLGRVIPLLPQGEVTPSEVKAEFQPSELGEKILEHWKEFSNYNSAIQPLYLQLMEEHIHGMLRVTRQMPRPLGNVISGFTTWCNKCYKRLTGLELPLFEAGFQDSILFQDGQLNRMFNYLRDNPRRLAIRRQFPELFTKLHCIERVGGSFTAYGNIFLLDKPSFYLLQVSRSANAEQLLQARAAMICAIAMHAVIVSACISPGEQNLMRDALLSGASLIALKSAGFPSIYKPAKLFFNACSAGHLLLLAPSAWDTCVQNKRMVTRDKCYVLNALAARIAGVGEQSIRYHGQRPQNLDKLLREAGFRV